jgi:hypothetical protein
MLCVKDHAVIVTAVNESQILALIPLEVSHHVLVDLLQNQTTNFLTHALLTYALMLIVVSLLVSPTLVQEHSKI